MSYNYLAGSTVDYVEGLEGAMFVVNNPNATSTCGCGASFLDLTRHERAGRFSAPCSQWIVKPEYPGLEAEIAVDEEAVVLEVGVEFLGVVQLEGE